MYKNKRLLNNKLLTKDDFKHAIRELCEPLKDYYINENSSLFLGEHGTYASENVANVEGYLRPLWGIIPLISGGDTYDFWNIYIDGIKKGTNYKSKYYWGEINGPDQRMVEMSVLGLGLCILPDKLWNMLNESEKNNLYTWLNQINKNEVVDSNWLYFRVMINIGFKKVGVKYNKIILEKDLARLDEFYLSDGWYSDGISEQRDYYIPFAMHYYSLIYSKIMEKEDPVRSKLFKERSMKFAKDFIYWFSKDGSAIPFGRSLTYKFAQSSFWSALVFAEIEPFSLGIIKGIICRNLRWWFNQSIFSRDGILNIGYSYTNHHMSEGYNALGSSYWALKTFLILSLPDDHLFWSTKELPLPELNEKSVQLHPHMIIKHSKKSNHIFALTSGQYADFKPIHYPAKYEKFVYSNIFGFSVPRSDNMLEQGAYDNMLALVDECDKFRVRDKCVDYYISNKYIYSEWKPWKNVNIKTWLVPYKEGHIRIHLINTSKKIKTFECGFAILKNDDMKFKLEDDKNSILIKYPWAISGIFDLDNIRKTKLIYAEPNTNIMDPRTLIPSLVNTIGIGTHILKSYVLGEVFEKLDEKYVFDINECNKYIDSLSLDLLSDD